MTPTPNTSSYTNLEDQKPIRASLFHTIKKDFHWKCLLSTLLVHSCIIYAIWCHLNFYAYASETTIFSYSYGACGPGYNFLPLGFGILIYIVYITESWHYWHRLNSIPRCGVDEIGDLVERMRTAIPLVWWKSVCYHYLRKTRQITRYRNGDAITATQVYYERVNSHSSGNIFFYESCGCKDISKDLINLELYPIIRMRITKGFVFACAQAAQEFEEQRTRFFNENEVRDDYMEVREGLDLAEVPFVEQIIVYSNGSNFKTYRPWFMRPQIFWAASILLLSWPLRMLIEFKTAHLNYQVTKLFGTNYLSPSSVNYTGPLTRTSTMESRELELATRQNYLIVPSYSEAILLDPLNFTSSSVTHQKSSIITASTVRNEFRPRNIPIISTNESPIISNYGSINNNNNNRINNEVENDYFNFNRPSFKKNRHVQRLLNNNTNYHYNNLQENSNSITSPRGITQQKIIKPKRSRSMSFFNSKSSFINSISSQQQNCFLPPKSSGPIPRPSQLGIQQQNISLQLPYNSGGKIKPLPQLYNNNNNNKIIPSRSISISGPFEYGELSTTMNFHRNNNLFERVEIDETENLLSSSSSSRNNKTVEQPPAYEIALQMCAPIYQRIRQSANSITSLLNSSASLITRSNSKDQQRFYSLEDEGGAAAAAAADCSTNVYQLT